METEIAQDATESVAKVSVLTLFLLVSAVASGVLSFLFHSSSFNIACALRVISLTLGSLAWLRLLNSVSIFFPKALAVPIHWVHAIAFEILSFAAVTLLRLAAFFYRFDRPIATSGKRPILLIHGYINTASVWVYIRWKLAKAGLGPIYALDLKNPFGSIEDHAKKVKLAIEAIQKQTGRSDIAIVGHSMGGLVARYYRRTFANEDGVAPLITIASPLRGTVLARIALGMNGRQMEYNSRWLDAFNQKQESLENVFSIATKTDQIVIPYRSAIVTSDPSHSCVFEDIGHASLLFSPRTADMLQKWLK